MKINIFKWSETDVIAIESKLLARIRKVGVQIPL